MENPNPVKKHSKLSSFLIVLMFGSMWILVVFLSPQPNNKPFPYPPQKPIEIKNDIGLNEVMQMGRQDLKHENLISKIRKDLKIPQEIEVKIFVGPFNNIVNEAQLLYPTNPFALILLLNENFYQDLNREKNSSHRA